MNQYFHQVAAHPIIHSLFFIIGLSLVLGWKRIVSFFWKKKMENCNHDFVPAMYAGLPTKVCTKCNSFSNISKQQFKHLFKMSFTAYKKMMGERAVDLKNFEKGDFKGYEK